MRVLATVFTLAVVSATHSQAPPEIRVEKNVPARMRDGVILRADVYRPAGAGRLPALLQRTPYSKNDRDAARRFSAIAAHGFVVIVQDTRGRYTSDGVAVPHDEADDGYDSVQWAAALPGVDGRVGMFGGSYLATTQLQAATRQPPALVALFPASSYNRRHDMVFQGGAFYLSDGLGWNLGQATDVRRRMLTPEVDRDGPIGLQPSHAALLRSTWLWHLPLKSFNELDLDRFAPGYRELLAHPDADSFWDRFDIEARHDRFLVPAFHLTGWYDTLLMGTLRNFAGLRARAGNETARQYQRLVIGPWTHARPTKASTTIGPVDFGPDAGFDADAAMIGWFDYWLRGNVTGRSGRPERKIVLPDLPDLPVLTNATVDTAPIRVFVMGENRWRHEQEWPLARARTTPYYLRSGGHANTLAGDGRLEQSVPGQEPADQYSYDPDNPVPTGESGGYSRAPMDRRTMEQRADVLVYTSAPLPADLEVTGPLSLTLWITSTARDTDFTGTLVDVFPDGAARALSDGILRARYRKGKSTPLLLTPGQPTEITIDLGATSNVFRAGHRIRLEVSSSNFPRFDRNPNTGGVFGEDAAVQVATQTILHDQAHPSRLLLPVIPRETSEQTTNGIVTQAAASMLIADATVVDGTGARARRASVRVVGDTITEIGDLRARADERVVDARGLVVAPGFIDTHNHSTDALLAGAAGVSGASGASGAAGASGASGADTSDPLAVSQISQGITTIVVGQDGSSPWPVGEYLDRLRREPPSLNVLTAVGHATIRRRVMGDDFARAATPDEVARMAALVEQGMHDGAVALSTGLEYEVGSYATTDEVVALAKVAARFGGFYISHIRDEADKAFDAMHEVVTIAEQAGLPVQNTHIKLGTAGVWRRAREALALYDAARAKGLDVTADAYPYNAWSSTITVLIPSRRFDDPDAVDKGLADVGGAANILITRHRARPEYEFKTLAAIAKEQAITPLELFMQIVRAGGASVVCTSMVDEDIRAFYRWPWTMISSDGGIGMRHPRGAGTFPRVLGRLVRERKWLTLEDAIRKMTSLPAARLKLTDRGVIRPGARADLVLFDPKTVIDRSTFADPGALSTGIRQVWVNGATVWDGERPTGARPGEVLRVRQR